MGWKLWAVLVFSIVAFFVLLTLPYVAHAQALTFYGCMSPDAFMEDHKKTRPDVPLIALDAAAFMESLNNIPPVSNMAAPPALMAAIPPDGDEVDVYVFRNDPGCNGLTLFRMLPFDRNFYLSIIDGEKGI